MTTSAMLFAGERIEEPIAWHGPFVATSNEELAQAIETYRAGAFPPRRVPWDYRSPPGRSSLRTRRRRRKRSWYALG